MQRLFVFALALAAVLAGSQPTIAREFRDIIASGELRVAIAAENILPWVGRGQNDELLGFEVDIATKFAEDLGVRAKFIERPFADLVPSLMADEADVIISGLSITPERARRIMYSRPYGQSDLDLVVSQSELPEGAEEQSYDLPGMKIAVMRATTAELEGRSRFPESEIITFDDFGDARDALLAADVNAIIAPKPYPAFIQLHDRENFVVVGDALSSTVEAMGIHPDNQRLLNYADSWIYDAMASGFLEAATSHWFESIDWIDQVPGLAEYMENMTAEDPSEATENEPSESTAN